MKYYKLIMYYTKVFCKSNKIYIHIGDNLGLNNNLNSFYNLPNLHYTIIWRQNENLYV